MAHSRRGYSHNGVDIPQPSSGGGGFGFNPNIYNQFLGNRIAEGNTIVNYEGQFDDSSGACRRPPHARHACFLATPP